MGSLRAVLAATDFSRDGNRAAQRAAVLAAQHGAELTLLHVVEAEGLSALMDWLTPHRDLRSAMASQAEMQLAALEQQLQRERRVATRRLLKIGNAQAEIEQALASHDLLVLGARGSHPVRELAIGTTADRLLRTAVKPLLVVRTAASQGYRRALALVDFSAAAKAAAREAIRLAPDADLSLLHAFDLPYEGKLRVAGVSAEEIGSYLQAERRRAGEQLRRMVAEIDAAGRCSSLLEHGVIGKAVRKAMEETRPDLVAVGKQGNSLLADVFLGSTTRTVLAEAHCDVLIVARGALSSGDAGAGVPE